MIALANSFILLGSKLQFGLLHSYVITEKIASDPKIMSTDKRLKGPDL